MLTINASYGLKEGRPNYGSETALCSVSLEVSETLSAPELKKKISSAFAIVREQVQEELNGKIKADCNQEVLNSDEGRGSTDKASSRQVSTIISICADRDIPVSELNKQLLAEFGAKTAYDLTKRDASKWLEKNLKGHRKAA